MERLKKREKLCFILFWSATGVATLFAAGVVLFGLNAQYAVAVVSALVSAFSIYCIPIYYNNAASCRAAAKLLSALEDGALELDALSAETGIERATAKKLLTKFIAKGLITEYEINGDTITKKI